LSDDDSVRVKVGETILEINPWERISEIAKRVGVKPMGDDHKATVTTIGGDGEHYDVFEVVIAVLDYIDAKTEDKRG